MFFKITLLEFKNTEYRILNFKNYSSQNIVKANLVYWNMPTKSTNSATIFYQTFYAMF